MEEEEKGERKGGEASFTFDGISRSTIPNQRSETPVFAWSRVMPVSLRNVEVRTPETLVRSIAIHVNINYARGLYGISKLK